MAVRKSKKVNIPATDVHRNFGNLIRRVFSGEEHFVVERDGLPVVAIISMVEYEELMREHEQRELEKQGRLKQFRQASRIMGEEIAKSGLDESELPEQLEESRKAVYKKRYHDDSEQ